MGIYIPFIILTPYVYVHVYRHHQGREEVKLFNIKIHNTRTVAWCYCNKQPGGVIVPSELVKTTNAIHRLQILNPNSQTVPECSVIGAVSSRVFESCTC